MGEIVKYHNDMNKIALAGFNEKELNILFSLIVLSRDKGTTELNVSFEKIRNLCNDDGKNKKRFIDSLTNVNAKLLQLYYKIETADSILMFTLFNKFKIDLNNDILITKINDDFYYLLNELVGNFTMFELVDFVNLKSSYSKNMFKLLKQWDTKHKLEISLEDFRYSLNVPQSYNSSKLNEKVLKPITEELSNIFPDFKITKKKKGVKIIGYIFSWGQKQHDIETPEDKIVEISEELSKAFEKASKNRFIQPFLTDNGKSELIEVFGNEEALIRGLHFAYKTIKKEFKSLLYLTKVITTGAEQQKVVVKTVKKDNYDIEVEDIQNDNIRQTSFDELPKEKKKIEVTEEEFEALYKKYLEENNASDSPFVRKGFAMPYSIKKENAEEK
ncbi:MAG: replication initiation protein [Clostridia bacterium]